MSSDSQPEERRLPLGAAPVKRRLAAILSADAAGYSRMMAEDEEATLRLLAAHRAVIDGIIQFHNGRIVGAAGDSVLAEFASPVEAVRCAVEVQEALKTRNDSLPEPRRLLFRVGVNLGDVVVKGDDLLGDGVNVAARLQSIAEPGSICISGSVYDQIAGKLSMGFTDIGEQTLKNIPRPVRAFRVAGALAPAQQAAQASRAGARVARHRRIDADRRRGRRGRLLCRGRQAAPTGRAGSLGRSLSAAAGLAAYRHRSRDDVLGKCARQQRPR